MYAYFVKNYLFLEKIFPILKIIAEQLLFFQNHDIMITYEKNHA
jgi:hypothetical protein